MFDVSPETAKADLREYRRNFAPELVPDDQDNVYRVPIDFQPRIPLLPDPESYLEALQSRRDQEIPIDVVPDINRRRIEPVILQSVIRAIKSSEEILVYYRSARAHEAKPHWIYPHALTHDGFRWAARCYVYRGDKDGYWGEIVLDRIEEVAAETRPAPIENIGKDEGWRSIVEIEIVPNPGLDEHEKSLIEAQYGMTGGRKSIGVRQCQLVYFLKRYQLEEPVTLKAPHQAPIALRDRAMAKDQIPPAMHIPLADSATAAPFLMVALRQKLPDLTEQEILERALTALHDALPLPA
jgi:hypothetical protein